MRQSRVQGPPSLMLCYPSRIQVIFFCNCVVAFIYVVGRKEVEDKHHHVCLNSISHESRVMCSCHMTRATCRRGWDMCSRMGVHVPSYNVGVSLIGCSRDNQQLSFQDPNINVDQAVGYTKLQIWERFSLEINRCYLRILGIKTFNEIRDYPLHISCYLFQKLMFLSDHYRVLQNKGMCRCSPLINGRAFELWPSGDRGQPREARQATITL